MAKDDKAEEEGGTGPQMSLADAIKAARAASTARTSRVAERRALGPGDVPELDFGSRDDYFETPGLIEIRPDLKPGEGAEAEDVPPGAEGGGAADGDEWEEAVDSASEYVYYFNRRTGATQWEQPRGYKPRPVPPPAEPEPSEAPVPLTEIAVVPPTAAGPKSAAAAPTPADVAAMEEVVRQAMADGAAAGAAAAKAAHEAARSGQVLHFYRDGQGRQHGPFTLPQLQGWRGALPMDLKVWGHVEEEKSGKFLAELLGDELLLYSWQAEHPGVTPAPTATEAAANLQRAVAGAGGATDFSSLAAAAMAGLPSTDQSVVAMAIGARGTQEMQDAARQQAFAQAMHGQYGDYTTRATVNSLTGRLQAEVQAIAGTSGGDSGSARLYSGMDKYLDINSLEAAMQEMKERKGKKPPPKVIKYLKARKAEVKKKMHRHNNPWLYD